MEDFAKLFMKGQIEYGPFWAHVQEAWERRAHPNLKILWYEDLKKDLRTVICQLSAFLKRHLTELKILQIDDFLYIGNYRRFREEHPVPDTSGKTRKFFRKGVTGDWRNHFQASFLPTWQAWIDQNKPVGLDLPISD